MWVWPKTDKSEYSNYFYPSSTSCRPVCQNRPIARHLLWFRPCLPPPAATALFSPVGAPRRQSGINTFSGAAVCGFDPIPRSKGPLEKGCICIREAGCRKVGFLLSTCFPDKLCEIVLGIFRNKGLYYIFYGFLLY